MGSVNLPENPTKSSPLLIPSNKSVSIQFDRNLPAGVLFDASLGGNGKVTVKNSISIKLTCAIKQQSNNLFLQTAIILGSMGYLQRHTCVVVRCTEGIEEACLEWQIFPSRNY